MMRFETNDSKFSVADALVPANETVILRLNGLHHCPYFSMEEFLGDYAINDQRAIIEWNLREGAVFIHTQVGAADLKTIDDGFRLKNGFAVTHYYDFTVAVISRPQRHDPQRYIFGYTLFDNESRRDVFVKFNYGLCLELDQSPAPAAKAGPHDGVAFIPARMASLVYAPIAAEKKSTLVIDAVKSATKNTPAVVSPSPAPHRAMPAAATTKKEDAPARLPGAHQLTEYVHNNLAKVRIDGDKPIELTINGQKRHYLPLNGHVIAKEEPVVALWWGDEGPDQWTTLDPQSAFLEKKYQELKSSLPSGLIPRQILIHTMAFVRSSKGFNYDAKEDYVAEIDAITPQWYNHIHEGARIAVIPIEELMIRNIGVCRHYTLLTRFLVIKLIIDHLLPAGDVYFHQDEITRQDGVRGTHAWVMYKPFHCAKFYWVDSFWGTELHTLPRDQARVIELYGDNAWQECRARYASNVQPPVASPTAAAASSRVAPRAVLMPPNPVNRAHSAATSRADNVAAIDATTTSSSTARYTQST